MLSNVSFFLCSHFPMFHCFSNVELIFSISCCLGHARYDNKPIAPLPCTNGITRVCGHSASALVLIYVEPHGHAELPWGNSTHSLDAQRSDAAAAASMSTADMHSRWQEKDTDGGEGITPNIS